jgi:hypothetical protein
MLRMSLGCGLRLSRWASIRRGPPHAQSR